MSQPREEDSVPCPECRAPAGSPCSYGLSALAKTHTMRVRLARARRLVDAARVELPLLPGRADASIIRCLGRLCDAVDAICGVDRG